MKRKEERHCKMINNGKFVFGVHSKKMIFVNSQRKFTLFSLTRPKKPNDILMWVENENNVQNNACGGAVIDLNGSPLYDSAPVVTGNAQIKDDVYINMSSTRINQNVIIKNNVRVHGSTITGKRNNDLLIISDNVEISESELKCSGSISDSAEIQQSRIVSDVAISGDSKIEFVNLESSGTIKTNGEIVANRGRTITRFVNGISKFGTMEIADKTEEMEGLDKNQLRELFVNDDFPF